MRPGSPVVSCPRFQSGSHRYCRDVNPHRRERNSDRRDVNSHCRDVISYRGGMASYRGDPSSFCRDVISHCREMMSNLRKPGACLCRCLSFLRGRWKILPCRHGLGAGLARQFLRTTSVPGSARSPQGPQGAGVRQFCFSTVPGTGRRGVLHRHPAWADAVLAARDVRRRFHSSFSRRRGVARYILRMSSIRSGHGVA